MKLRVHADMELQEYEIYFSINSEEGADIDKKGPDLRQIIEEAKTELAEWFDREQIMTVHMRVLRMSDRTELFRRTYADKSAGVSKYSFQQMLEDLDNIPVWEEERRNEKPLRSPEEDRPYEYAETMDELLNKVR